MPVAPFSPESSVRDALEAYLAENGFTFAGYDAKWTKGSFFGIPLVVPNTRRHRWGLMLHDLHHVVTGYGTDLVGEGELSAWELRHGLPELGVYVGSIVAFGALAGALLAPRRALRAWRDAADARSLHAQCTVTDEAAYAALLNLTVGELRARLGVARGGVVTGLRRLHHYAPA